MTTETHITDAQIEALRTEAGRAGDLEMVDVCDQAIAGGKQARQECANVIAEASAAGTVSYWTSADNQSDIHVEGMTEDAARALLLDMCGTEEERAVIRAGSFS